MDNVKNFLSALPKERRLKVEEVYDHILGNYPDVRIRYDFSPKSDFPVFCHCNDMTYVAVACPKSYISIHFSHPASPQIITSANSKIKAGIGCAKIPDSVDFPMEKIRKAIDLCYDNVVTNKL